MPLQEMIDSSLFFLGGLGGCTSGGEGVDRLYVTLATIFHPSFLPTKNTWKWITALRMSCSCSPRGRADMLDSLDTLLRFHSFPAWNIMADFNAVHPGDTDDPSWAGGR